MAHNPILGRYILGVIDKFIITENQVGLLYRNHRFERRLQAGESPTLNEKLGSKIKGHEVAVYVIDLRAHPFDWRVNLPTQDNLDFFPVEIRMSYRVSNPERMVENEIKDTEQEVARYLEKELARQSRRYSLNQHVQADNELTDWINHQGNLQLHCGVELVAPADVQIRLSKEQERRVKQLNELDIRMRTPQTHDFKGQVPSKDTPLSFEVQVQVEYHVSKNHKEDLPSGDLDQAAASLEPRILAVLRRVSRKYPITELREADEGFQEKLDDALDDFSRAGLEVDTVSVSCDLNPEARQRYLEKLEVMHKAEMEELQMKGVQKSADVVIGLIEKGNYAVLAMAVARGEIPMTELSKRLDEQQLKQFQFQMSVLEKFTGKELLNEGIIYNQTGRLAANLTDYVTGGQPPLSGQENGQKASLPDGTSGPQGVNPRP